MIKSLDHYRELRFEDIKVLSGGTVYYECILCDTLFPIVLDLRPQGLQR